MKFKSSSSPFFETSYATEQRKKVNSFDVFDTLVARRCIEPTKIFEQVGLRANIENFTSHRRRAEASVATGSYTLDDIYKQLATYLNIPEARANEIKGYEIAAELEAIVPLVENIAKVNDGDLLLTDMYLGENTILELLAKAGLNKNIKLIVTSDGKRSGKLWPELLKNYSIQKHLGDNQHSDIAMPMQFGIPGIHTSLANPTNLELAFINKGLRDLAVLIRETRLTTWHADSLIRRVQLAQISFNFPLLLLSSISLLRLVKKLGITRLLFCSRDCNLWWPLAQIISHQMNVSCEIEYFYTSRIARLQPSADYLSYARDRLQGRTLLIDLCGTGWSGSLLFRNLGMTNGQTFYIHHLKPLEIYEKKHKTLSNCTAHSILGPENTGLSNPRLEMCNYAEHASVKDVHFSKGEILPIFDTDERPDNVRNAIKEQRTCFVQTLELLKKAPLDETLKLDDDSIKKIIKALYCALSKEDILTTIYNQSHRNEDVKTLRDLGLA